MEVHQQVWLRRDSSQWGWVPAVIVRKDDGGNNSVNITLVNDSTSQMSDDERDYFAQEPEFTQVIRVDKEQLKSADHDDIKLRNIRSSEFEEDQNGRHSPTSALIRNSRRGASSTTTASTMPVGGVDDLIGLTHLHEPAILHALRLRYDADIIYTSTGPILIAVNPFKPMPTLYQSSTMEAYRCQGENARTKTGSKGNGVVTNRFNTPAKRRSGGGALASAKTTAGSEDDRLSPHVYQTADDAYRQMLRGLETQGMTERENNKKGNRGRSPLRQEQDRDELETSSGKNQSILVSGESGAGKTVTTKIVLDYFAMLSKKRSEQNESSLPSPSHPALSTSRKSWNTNRRNTAPTKPDEVSIEQQVLQSNPILEAFGNARTIRNDNSSRFGKYIDIAFDSNGKLAGARIETYLLEKVRLIHPGADERNYHIFYQFLSAASAEERSEFFLGNKTCRDFRLLADNGQTFDRRDGVSDHATHRDMLSAMTTIGFDEETIYSLMRLISALLFAGNMSFTPSQDNESCKLDKTKASLACAALLGITFEGLATALTKRSIIAAKETVQQLLFIEEAGKACEALIKAVYGAMFDFIVEQVNASLERASQRSSAAAAAAAAESSGSTGPAAGPTAGASIGVLDIFGFETFDYNSFEQLCINYTNEALQQQFNRYVFKLEQQEYEKEGILWKFIEFPDNQDVLDLIDVKHTGIIALLDEQCMLPRSTDHKFTRYLYAKCDRHARFSATSAQRVDYLFSIEHYAGLVEYTTEGWLEKNKDQLPASASELIQTSDFELLLDINRFVRAETANNKNNNSNSSNTTSSRFGGAAAAGMGQSRGTVATKSVSYQFAKQLKILRSRIETTVPHYIRCLKPNDELCPDYFEPKNIVQQLRCGGVLEAVRVSRAGYPTRYPHDIFTARYYILGNRASSSRNSLAPTAARSVFSPGHNTALAREQKNDEELKRLIAKMALDLWQIDHEIFVAQRELERKCRESHSQYEEVRTKCHPSAVGQRLIDQTKTSIVPLDQIDKNLVVESSVFSPEFQRKQLRKTVVNSHKSRSFGGGKGGVAGASKSKDHKVTRPESKEDFLALDFASRCAVAGLQLGLTKVFLRREAFDRIESMRSEKFFNAAASIQKIVRGRWLRQKYIDMKLAAVILQCFMRMKIAERRVCYERYHQATVKIQCAWRVFTSRQYVFEMQLARRIAAMVIQRAYREYKNVPEGPSDEEVTYCMTRIQARWRGYQERIRFQLFVQELHLEHERLRLQDERREQEERERERREAAQAEAQRQRMLVVSPVKEQHSATGMSQPVGLPSSSPAVHERSLVSHQEDPSEEEQLRTLLRQEEEEQSDPNQLVAYDNAQLADLFNEIHENNWAVVENILDKNPELAESPDTKSGELALHKIARHSTAWTLLIDMVLVLFPKALIHRDDMGALPIHHASAHDNLQALEIIHSAYKEGINDTDKMGRLPIHVAANYDAVDAIKFLLKMSPEGAYTMVYRPPHNSGGGLPLHIACRNHGSIGVITALLAENFASAKRTDENGDLPLHLLLRCGEVVDPVVVKTLLTCFSGAVSRTDMNGDLPLSIAIKYSCSSTVVNAILLQFSDAAAVLDGQGHSPLHLAFFHCADDRTIMGLLNHGPPEFTIQVDKKTGLLPIQVATEKEHTHFIVHTLLKMDLPIDMTEKVRAQLKPHHYSWNHVVSKCDDLYYQVVTKVLQACTQPQVLALAHIEGPDGKIALAAASPVCKHEMRVMLRLFNTLEVVNQRPAYTNPVSDTQIFYALRYDPPPQVTSEAGSSGFRVIHEEKALDGVCGDDYIEELDDNTVITAASKMSTRSLMTTRTQQSIDDKLRLIRREKGQQVIAKLTSKAEIVERELKVRKDYHLSRHYVPAIISVHHTVQHAAYSEAMAEPGYCITMEGADTTAENMMLDLRKQQQPFPNKALKRIGISLLHIHEHGIVHGDFGTHNIGKFGSRWKLLGVGGSIPINQPTDPSRGFYHPPESIVVENRRASRQNPMGKKSYNSSVVSIPALPQYDIWAFGVILYEAVAGLPLQPYSCRGKRQMSAGEVARIGLWDDKSLRNSLKMIPQEQGDARDIIKLTLHPDPKKRASSMRQILEHRFFSSGDEFDDVQQQQQEQGHQFLLQQEPTQRFDNTHGFDTNDAFGFDMSKNAMTTVTEDEEDEPGFIMSPNIMRHNENRRQQQQPPSTKLHQINGVMTSSTNSSNNSRADGPILKTGSGSTDNSAENRENGVRGAKATVQQSPFGKEWLQPTERTASDAGSVKSGRSFGGGFRKFAKNTFRQKVSRAQL